MQLTVLGTRSGMPAEGQPSSGYLVEAGTAGRLLLDCGPGITTALSAVTPVESLDAVVISHMHADHCYDLLPLGKALLHARAARVLAETTLEPMQALTALDASAPGVPLYVPVGGRAVLDRLAALFPVATFPLLDRAFDIAFDVREYEPGAAFTVGDCAVSLHPGRHTAPNCGARIASPLGTLSYTGDTGLAEGLRGLADGVDLLLAEATLDATDHGPHGHLSATDAGRIAAENGVGELVLTHFATGDPAVLHRRRAAAAAVFTGPVHIARPGLRLPVAARAPLSRP
ncbi:MAG: MBL fold metallo-hydrolase [Pseudonocardia sp.]|nr:MBL fold metallo-hydrolase [Pseudonocardia sp.]